jgi:hypothetical protein
MGRVGQRSAIHHARASSVGCTPLTHPTFTATYP